MKITRVEPLYLRLPEVNSRADGTQDTLIVRVHTDAGLVGLGEVDSSPLVAKAVIEAPLSHATARGLADCVVGEDPLDIDRLWRRPAGAAVDGARAAVMQQQVELAGHIFPSLAELIEQLAGTGQLAQAAGYPGEVGIVGRQHVRLLVV